MTNSSDHPLKRIVREIHRRSLWQVLGVYLVASWGVLEAIEGIVGTAGLPDWLPPFALVLLLIGLPIVLATAFVQEGMKGRDPEEEAPAPRDVRVRSAPDVHPPEAAPPTAAIRRLFTWRNALLGGVAAFALWGVVAAAWLVVAGRGSPAPEEEAADRGDSRRERSIAVLPFQNLSGDPEADPFAAGIHDDLLTRLARIDELRVISRTSVNRYRQTGKSLPEIARELGVVWIVEGGVQRAGDRVRVNAQLIDGRTDEHQWGEDYDRQLSVENIFEIQTDLARRIAAALQAELSPEEERRIAGGSTASLEAYDLYQRGRFSLNSRTPAGIRRALDYFTRAVERDSTYTLAYTGLSDALTLGWYYGYDVGAEPLDRALETARRAVGLDPDLAEAHTSLGWTLSCLRDAPGAEEAFRTALQLDPNLSTAHHWYSLLLQVINRPAQALEHAQRSLEMDPLSPAIHLTSAAAYVAGGDVAESMRLRREAVDLEPAYGFGWITLGWETALRVDPETGIEHLERGRALLLEKGDSIFGSLPRLAAAHALAGRPDTARALLEQAERQGSEPFYIGIAHLALGERDSAFDWLARSRWERNLVRQLRWTPVLEPLRSEPRFDELMVRMEEAWGLASREGEGP